MLGNEEMSELVALVGNGDQQAFARLFNHLAPRVASYLQRGGTPAPAAEDLAQEAMVLLWRKARSFDPARGAVATWVFAIARHLRIDQHRRQGGVLTRSLSDVDHDFDLEEYEIADSEPSPEEYLSAAQRDRRVREAMKQLSPQQVHLLQLSFFAESPHFDIARDLDLPLGTVKSQIRRALLQMRRSLEASQS